MTKLDQDLHFNNFVSKISNNYVVQLTQQTLSIHFLHIPISTNLIVVKNILKFLSDRCSYALISFINIYKAVLGNKHTDTIFTLNFYYGIDQR